MEILNDFDTSLRRALEEIDPHYEKYNALVICGTHFPSNVMEQMEIIKEYRKKKLPVLGICFGHQLAAVEYARNVLGKPQSVSEEWGVSGLSDYIVQKRPEGLKVGLHEVYDTVSKRWSKESFWNYYEVVNNFDSLWNKEDNFITVQWHPEYQSSKHKPHPLLVKFLQNAEMAM